MGTDVSTIKPSCNKPQGPACNATPCAQPRQLLLAMLFLSICTKMRSSIQWIFPTMRFPSWMNLRLSLVCGSSMGEPICAQGDSLYDSPPFNFGSIGKRRGVQMRPACENVLSRSAMLAGMANRPRASGATRSRARKPLLLKTQLSCTGA